MNGFTRVGIVLGIAFLIAVANTGVRANPVTVVNGAPGVTFTYQAPGSTSSATATFTLNGNVLTVVLSNTSGVGDSEALLSSFGFDAKVGVSSFSGSGAAANWGLVTALDSIAVGEPAYGKPWQLQTHSDVLRSFQQCGFGPCSGTLTFTLLNFSGNLIIDSTGVVVGGHQMLGSETVQNPEPASLLLLGTGIIGLASGVRRRFGTFKADQRRS